MMPNYVSDDTQTITFNTCKFYIDVTGIKAGFVNCMGGTHIFNQCTFDYTGGSMFGSNHVVRWSAVNAYSEKATGYSTSVILNGCTRINCATQKYGEVSSLVTK